MMARESWGEFRVGVVAFRACLGLLQRHALRESNRSFSFFVCRLWWRPHGACEPMG